MGFVKPSKVQARIVGGMSEKSQGRPLDDLEGWIFLFQPLVALNLWIMKIWDFQRSDSDFKFCQSGQINQRFLFCKLAGMILYVLNAGIITTYDQNWMATMRNSGRILGFVTSCLVAQPSDLHPAQRSVAASRKLLYRLSLAPQDNLGKVSWHRWGGWM